MSAVDAWNRYIWNNPKPGDDISGVVGQAFRDGYRKGEADATETETEYSDAAEPVDDFDYTDYPEYDSSAYMDGYEAAKVMASQYDQFTFSVPKGVTFTLTVTG